MLLNPFACWTLKSVHFPRSEVHLNAICSFLISPLLLSSPFFSFLFFLSIPNIFLCLFIFTKTGIPTRDGIHLQLRTAREVEHS